MISGNTPAIYSVFWEECARQWHDGRVVRMPWNPATGVRSPKGSLRFLSSLLFPVKVIA